MLLHVVSISHKASPFATLLSKNSNTALFRSKSLTTLSEKCIFLVPIVCNAKNASKNPVSMTRKAPSFSTTSAEVVLRKPDDSGCRRTRKKMKHESPEIMLRIKLEQCSKDGDLNRALHLYEEARANNVPLNVYHYNVLLYLFGLKSCDADNEDDNSSTLDKGFEIFNQMKINKVEANEATFTNVSRLAAARKDPVMAFDLIKKMKDQEIVPKLRSYGPALYGFCNKGLADEAYEVDSHMVANGLSPEEPELNALLRVSSEVKREGKVYEFMQRLRATVRQVSEETASTVEAWFMSEKAGEVGTETWDVKKVKKGVLDGGGGWHGQGWLGTGKWRVVRTTMDENGVCQSCKEKLVCIDIDPKETENFAMSLAKLAFEKETRNNFVQFQEWLQRNGPFDAVIDGANLGLANQHTLSFAQISRVVNQLRRISPSRKFPLVVLHQSRVNGGPAQNPYNKRLLETWKKAGALYPTPQGSNDDWYWLYAAVSSKCLLVTNDEMRDHLFQLLGNSFFPRWKEKHQVRLKPSSEGLLTLHMPPPYSNVIQESEQGSWHVPTVTGDDIETPRQWICATRRSGRIQT